MKAILSFLVIGFFLVNCICSLQVGAVQVHKTLNNPDNSNSFGKFFYKPWMKPAAPTITITPNKPRAVDDEVALSAHNAIRLSHNVPNLMFNATLKSLAKDCSHHHVTQGTDPSVDPSGGTDPRATICPLIASTASLAAESLFKYELPPSGFDNEGKVIFSAVATCYNTQPDPIWAAPSYNFLNKQKVQLIWKSTTQFACATSYPKFYVDPAAKIWIYVSCLYSPAGNEPPSAFKDNVQRF